MQVANWVVGGSQAWLGWCARKAATWAKRQQREAEQRAPDLTEAQRPKDQQSQRMLACGPSQAMQASNKQQQQPTCSPATVAASLAASSALRRARSRGTAACVHENSCRNACSQRERGSSWKPKVASQVLVTP